MKNKLRNRLAALALCGVMIFSGSASALADSPAGEINDTDVVQEVVVEEADTEVLEESTEEVITEEVVAETPAEEVTEEVTEETPVEEVTEEVTEETPVEEVTEEVTEETQPTVVEAVVEAVQTAAETVVEVVETIIEYIIGTHDDLTYRDDQVVIKVFAEEDGVIPEGTKIKVVPILAEDETTKAQYEEVAAGLQEKAAEDAQVVEGFLAYDISLVDPDGNEFEPNGEVKVSIEYKEEAVPAEVEVVEDAEVTVHHFEEDVNGNVKEVVDMFAKVVELEKVEFKTNSFSVFTITWTGSSRSATITVHYVDKDGNEIEGITASDVTLNSGTSLNLSNYRTTIEGYSYLRTDFDTVGSNRTANYIRVNNNTLQYANNNSSYSWTTWESISSGEYTTKDIYLVYESLQPIATIDSQSKHVNISLTDYSRWSAGSLGHQVITNINDNHSLKFVTTGNELRNPAYNVYTNGASPYQGIVKNNLTSAGFPYLAVADESLEYLFNTTGKTYQANHLFKEVGGYYIYDSAQNFAEFDPVTGNFTVYGQSKVGFFPFNDFTDDVQATQTSENAVTNHHFGMHVDYTFMQPVNGKNGTSDMIFEFKGDDDVWVFIDGMLVLDIGGIHQSSSGTINFATGEVTYSNATNTTIYNMYLQAWQEAGYSDTKIAELTSQYFVVNSAGQRVFKNYSQHKLDFFYLERGAHDTNCMIKFNLTAIPENTIAIEKEITKSNMADFADAEFKFQIEKKEVDSNGDYPEQGTILANTAYKLYSVDADGERTFIETRTTDANGQFTLKHRQVAEFERIYASTKYCVTELGVTSEVYEKVDVNGSDIQIKHKVDDDGLNKLDYTTGDLLAQEYVYVKFGNQCNASNLRNLVIEKKLAANQTSAETFAIKLEFAEGEGWVPFVGTYFLGSSTGTAVTTNNGIINLTAGQKAYILGLISGTEYRVTEELTEEQKVNFMDPKYEGTGTATETGITGVMEILKVTDENTDHVATITNTLLTKTVNVTKVWADTKATHDSIYVGLYKNVDGQWQATGAYAELKEGAWTATFEDLDLAFEYDVKELVQVADGEFTIGEATYAATNKYYTVGSDDYEVSYVKVDEPYTTEVTITNTLLNKIEVEKVWEDGNTDHTDDVVYVGLYKVSQDQKELVAVQELTATTWKAVFVKLEALTDATYEVRELLPGENETYTAIEEGGIYTNGAFDYTVAYTKDGDSKVVITNTIKDTVVVEKIWADANNANGKRPKTLAISMKNGEEVVGTFTFGTGKQGAVETIEVNGKTVRVEFTTDWCATLYGASSKTFTFEEAKVAGYVSNQTVTDDKVTFTNTFNIIIIKESLTGKFALEGAIFKMANDEETYYVKSSANGFLNQWYKAFDGSQVSQPVDTILDGTYALSEIVAPAGYMLSNAEWDVQIANNLIVKVDGETGTLTELRDSNTDVYAYTIGYANKALYALPSTGGLGIYVPMMSGVFMMMAAAFILMNNKRKEVL